MLPFNYIFKERNLCSTKRYFRMLFCNSGNNQKKGLKNTIFLFHHFLKFHDFSSQNYKFLFPIQFQCKDDFYVLLIKIAFFAFLLPFFEAFGENKCCLSITYFKRETYALQNVIFGCLFVSREIIKKKASKTRFFYFIIFEISWFFKSKL